TTDEKPRKLDVVFHDMEASGDDVTIFGRIANDGTSLSEATRAIVVLYNTIGEPLRLDFTYTDPRDVLPLSSGTFSLKFATQDLGNVAGYAIYSESVQYAEAERLLVLEVVSLEKLEDTAKLDRFSALNTRGESVSSVRVGEPALLKVGLTSDVSERQQYMYILQIRDQNDYVVSISWLIAHLDAGASGEASIAWIPPEPGTYTADAFVWNNLEDAVPLSFTSLSKTLRVS
ncbi:MAG: hypothetical protein ACE5JV_03350, partial [Nitrososphaerales archaeon]